MKFSFVEEDMLVVGIAVGIVIFFCVDKDVGIVDRLKVAVALFSHRHKASSSKPQTHSHGGQNHIVQKALSLKAVVANNKP